LTYHVDENDVMWAPQDVVREQIASVLAAWGMKPEHVAETAAVMVDADACGIDTHGISMLPPYDDRRRRNVITLDVDIKIVKETPTTALIDAGGGLGYVPSLMATRMCIEKAKKLGMAAITVRESAHFGATGFYTRMMAAEGLIGIATTNGSGPRTAPTFGKEGKLSTNPIAFAAPTRRNDIFSLDMATTTVAAGKIRNKWIEGDRLPLGWANDADGNPSDDPEVYISRGGTQTPLGGSRELGGHKGYGLAAMVEILSASFSGASLDSSPNHGNNKPGSMEIGHFFLAIDPTQFRDAGEFEDSTDELIDYLHGTKPLDPDKPVMVAGEPENIVREERKTTGIPIPPGLRGQIQEIARQSNAAFLLV
jgi:LDH2 family malate/lactate/ureidoglycolate dehydrogenase